ncbi:hypothetical protein HU200_039195 [Digitaria exilis]|uniref:Protein TIC 20 n=1 Tax=Digitaria exilis TaxID=1010633 RepID=A0A835BNP2_9POAL|nr:hypothetical protein HU200_039195 [Digitaria exilis]
MFPCQGVATVNPQLLGVPAASRYGSTARPSLRARPASLSLQDPAFRHKQKSLALRAGADFQRHVLSSSFAKYNPINGITPLMSSPKLHPRTQFGCQASLSSFSYPELSSKPKWWWRSLACVPYLLPLHNMWGNADAIYQLHPYLQRFSLLYAFIDTMALLPGWLFLVIFMTIYFFVVRRKWSPHFLRFHVILAILLDTGSQALATAVNWSPSIVFQGKPMAYFWMTMAFIQMFTVVECMRCALSGLYPNVPFVSHTAFIHSDLNLFR